MNEKMRECLIQAMDELHPEISIERVESMIASKCVFAYDVNHRALELATEGSEGAFRCFEYMMETAGDSITIAKINEWGTEGWELVAIQNQPGGVPKMELVFKREIV